MYFVINHLVLSTFLLVIKLVEHCDNECVCLSITCLFGMRINDKKLFELNNLSSKKQAWSWSKTGNFSGKKLSNKI